MRKLISLGILVLFAVATVVGVMGFAPEGAKAVGEPPAGTTNSIQTYTLYEATAIITDDTYYSDGQQFQHWNAADIFVIADVGTGVFTVTAQVSPDDENYANLDYEWGDSDSLNTQVYQRVMSADGTEIMRVPMAGEWLRVSIVTSGTVTPTIMATMRNN